MQDFQVKWISPTNYACRRIFNKELGDGFLDYSMKKDFILSNRPKISPFSKKRENLEYNVMK
ncbi:hypothetical protein WKT22_00277 [Candidatus Lokiarchaeum ossiferum]